MTRLFELPLDRFIAVEFAVNDDPGAPVLARDRLISSCKVDDAEPRVPKGNSPVGCNPMALPIRAPVIKTLGSALHYRCRDGITTREESNNSAHTDVLLASVFPDVAG